MRLSTRIPRTAYIAASICVTLTVAIVGWGGDRGSVLGGPGPKYLSGDYTFRTQPLDGGDSPQQQ